MSNCNVSKEAETMDWTLTEKKIILVQMDDNFFF